LCTKHLIQAEKADWLIGEACILPGVKGTALRSLKAPGTAYDDPECGKDTQIWDYAELDSYTKENKDTVEADSGGVHIFSGIPNKAFYNAAVAFGGNTWESVGKIWWGTVHGKKITKDCTFKEFAEATVAVAEKLMGAKGKEILTKAWTDVNVLGDGKAKSGKVTKAVADGGEEDQAEEDQDDEGADQTEHEEPGEEDEDEEEEEEDEGEKDENEDEVDEEGVAGPEYEEEPAEDEGDPEEEAEDEEAAEPEEEEEAEGDEEEDKTATSHSPASKY
jgi:hypothetical protein